MASDVGHPPDDGGVVAPLLRTRPSRKRANTNTFQEQPCPVCGNLFPARLIETHADRCAGQKFLDTASHRSSSDRTVACLKVGTRSDTSAPPRERARPSSGSSGSLSVSARRAAAASRAATGAGGSTAEPMTRRSRVVGASSLRSLPAAAPTSTRSSSSRSSSSRRDAQTGSVYTKDAESYSIDGNGEATQLLNAPLIEAYVLPSRLRVSVRRADRVITALPPDAVSITTAKGDIDKRKSAQLRRSLREETELFEEEDAPRQPVPRTDNQRRRSKRKHHELSCKAKPGIADEPPVDATAPVIRRAPALSPRDADQSVDRDPKRPRLLMTVRMDENRFVFVDRELMIKDAPRRQPCRDDKRTDPDQMTQLRALAAISSEQSGRRARVDRENYGEKPPRQPRSCRATTVVRPAEPRVETTKTQSAASESRRRVPRGPPRQASQSRPPGKRIYVPFNTESSSDEDEDQRPATSSTPVVLPRYLRPPEPTLHRADRSVMPTPPTLQPLPRRSSINNDAISFVQRMRVEYNVSPERIQRFITYLKVRPPRMTLTAAQEYRQGRLTRDEVVTRIGDLLRDYSDLVVDFHKFLPAAESATEGLETSTAWHHGRQITPEMVGATPGSFSAVQRYELVSRRLTQEHLAAKSTASTVRTREPPHDTPEIFDLTHDSDDDDGDDGASASASGLDHRASLAPRPRHARVDNDDRSGSQCSSDHQADPATLSHKRPRSAEHMFASARSNMAPPRQRRSPTVWQPMPPYGPRDSALGHATVSRQDLSDRSLNLAHRLGGYASPHAVSRLPRGPANTMFPHAPMPVAMQAMRAAELRTQMARHEDVSDDPSVYGLDHPARFRRMHPDIYGMVPTQHGFTPSPAPPRHIMAQVLPVSGGYHPYPRPTVITDRSRTSKKRRHQSVPRPGETSQAKRRTASDKILRGEREVCGQSAPERSPSPPRSASSQQSARRFDQEPRQECFERYDRRRQGRQHDAPTEDSPRPQYSEESREEVTMDVPARARVRVVATTTVPRAQSHRPQAPVEQEQQREDSQIDTQPVGDSAPSTLKDNKHDLPHPRVSHTAHLGPLDDEARRSRTSPAAAIRPCQPHRALVQASPPRDETRWPAPAPHLDCEDPSPARFDDDDDAYKSAAARAPRIYREIVPGVTWTSSIEEEFSSGHGGFTSSESGDDEGASTGVRDDLHFSDCDDESDLASADGSYEALEIVRVAGEDGVPPGRRQLDCPGSLGSREWESLEFEPAHVHACVAKALRNVMAATSASESCVSDYKTMKAAVTRLVDRFRDDPHSIDLLAATILQASQESVTASHPPEAVQSILVQVVHTTQPFRPFPQMFRNLEGLCAPDGRKLLDEIIDLQPGGQQIRDLLGDKVPEPARGLSVHPSPVQPSTLFAHGCKSQRACEDGSDDIITPSPNSVYEATDL